MSGHIRKWVHFEGRYGGQFDPHRREEGQAMAEYAVILALVAAAVVLAYSALGTTTMHLFDEVVSQLGP